MGRPKRTVKKKENERIVDWTEYIERNNPNRALQPKPEMLTDRGYYDRKAMYYGIVSIRYDVRYVAYWLNKYVLNKLGISSNELLKIISGTFQGGFSYMASNMLKPFDTNIPGLGKATFAEFFQFLAEETKAGRFWMIIDNITDRVLFMTDNAEPDRLVVPSNQYIGVNRLNGWRDSMDEYHRLKHLLATEKVAPSFEYKWYRMDDSFTRFQKSYYFIDELFGTQCYANVSEGWELLRPAPTWEEKPSDVVEEKSPRTFIRNEDID